VYFKKTQRTSTQIGGHLEQQRQASTKLVGDAAESAVLGQLQGAGLTLVQRNYKTPGRGGGEIDLIMREPDGTLVFIEVRQRSSAAHGGAAASVSATKQRRIVLAARFFLMRFGNNPPACRFDVVAVEGSLQAQAPGEQQQKVQTRIDWIRSAFTAD
jgi:putative endonuclease